MIKLSIFIGIVCATVAFYLNSTNDSQDDTLKWSNKMAQESEALREQFKTEQNSAFVVGYTGESGKALVHELLTSKVFSKLYLFGRRKVDYDPELVKGVEVEQLIIDYDNIEQHADLFKDFHDGFCCLGTTRGKSGADGFYKVDHDYTMGVAKLAKNAGTKHFHLVSSQGANKNAWVLYTKTKGEVEEEIKNLGFDRYTVYRPAVLMCDREESRPGEAIARTLLKPVAWAFPTAITTPIQVLASAMVNAAVSPGDGKPFTLLENKAIHKLGKQPKK